MQSIFAFTFIRKIMWRLGRKIYTYSRGDIQNNPSINGEYWLLKKVVNGISNQSIFFDIGANKGNWTAKALSFSKDFKNIYIYAFEPSKVTRAILEDRFRGNTSISVQSYALSSSNGKAFFYSQKGSGGTNSLSPISGTKSEVVRLYTIDCFISDLGIKSISMIKIDTEGFDFLVLKGAERSLSEGVIEVIQFEYNWRWLINHVCLKDVFDLIANKPYLFGKLVGNTIEFYDKWHFELDRFFENNFVLIKENSVYSKLGLKMYFDNSNVANKSNY